MQDNSIVMKMSDLYFVLSVLETQVILDGWGFERICLWKFCNSNSVGKMRGLEIMLFLGTNISLLILRDQNPICWIHWVFSFSGQVERGWMIELLYNLLFWFIQLVVIQMPSSLTIILVIWFQRTFSLRDMDITGPGSSPQGWSTNMIPEEKPKISG